MATRGSLPVNVQPLRIDEQTFLAVIWSGLAISAICVAMRLFVRIKVFKRLWMDDACVVFALVLALATAILWQLFAKDMFAVMAVTSGQSVPKHSFLSLGEAFKTIPMVILIFFYSTLWTIKLSFLLFFKRLTKDVRRQQLLWWPITVFTIATYFVCIGTIPYRCFTMPFLRITAECTQNAAVKFQRVTLQLNCAWDVVTDVLSLLTLYGFGRGLIIPTVMSIPLSMLWGVQIRFGQKAALAGIFSLVVITIAFAIIRVAIVSSLSHLPDESYLYMWSAIETAIGR
ncbi:MAG: hypothetical protein Q9188_000901 [Gyalolechia gomerana]